MSELKMLKPTNLDLPVGTKFYINESLCPYNRDLWNRCKKLWNRRKLFSFFTVNGSVGVKLQENVSYNIIAHIDDSKEIFLEEDFTIRQGIFSNNLTPWVTLNSEVSDQRPCAKDQKTELSHFSKWTGVT